MTEQALVAIEDGKEAEVYTPEGAEKILTKIEGIVGSTVYDISDQAQQDECRSMAYRIRRTKSLLDNKGKEYTADLRAKVSAVNSVRNTYKDKLVELEEKVRRPLTEYEDALKEADNVVDAWAGAADVPVTEDVTVEQLQAAVDLIERADIEEYHEEKWDTLKAAKTECLKMLADKIAQVEKREADKAEAERMRKENEELKRKQEEDRIRAEAAEKARKEAEEKAARDAAAAKEAQERAEREAEEAKKREAEAKAKAERDAKEAAERAEREKQEAIEQAHREAEEKRKREEAEAKAKAEEKARLAAIAPEMDQIDTWLDSIFDLKEPDVANLSKEGADIIQAVVGALNTARAEVAKLKKGAA